LLALSEAEGRELQWVSWLPSLLEIRSELRGGDDVFVTIRAILNKTYEATTARHHWWLWQVGVIHRRVLIDPERNKETAIVFPWRRRWTSGGLFEPRPGVAFELRRTSFSGSAWEWRDGRATPLVTFRWSQLRPTRVGGEVTIRRDAFSLRDLDLLVVLGEVVCSLAMS
jgi:hypothetical protein